MKSKKTKDTKQSGIKEKTTLPRDQEQFINETGEASSERDRDAEKEEIITSRPYQELNDKYLRLYSEFDNYRKRTIRERVETLKKANQDVIEALLPVLDDFERAIKSNEELEGCDAIKEGVLLIYQKLSNILAKKGLQAIDVIGKEFDTDYHEAITFIPASSEELKGKVVDQVEKGYLLNDMVIRYAKVVIGQ